MTEHEQRVVIDATTPEGARSQMADAVTELLTNFAKNANMDACSVYGVVAAQLLDDMMELGHAECALNLSLAASREATQRMMEDIKAKQGIEAFLEKTFDGKTEH